jgi:hypothetical protein
MIVIAIKTINAAKLLEELLAVAPVQSVTWAGFTATTPRLYDPFPEATRIVGRSSTTGDDIAQRGELRINGTFTAPQQTAITSAVTAHVSTLLTAEQTRQDQDGSDLDTIRNAFNGWAGLNNTQRFDALRLAVRILLRRERADPI